MRQIGHYSLIDEIGRGGQATVFLAEDSRLKRKVALKVLSETASSAQETLERFRREAEVASKLDHPGICPVYEAGVEGGVPFIAMRYIEGESLARRIARAATLEGLSSGSVDLDSGATSPSADPTPTPTPSTAGRARLSKDEILANALIIEKVARALHAAHELGVIHRDIKPANIMITPQGDPIILDLGLARDETTDLQTLTRTGDVFGTPAYMSPEQLTGQRIKADRRTDVYALGATLYEAVTQRRPFEAPTREALYQAILTDLPSDARRVNPRIPVELKIVMETALEKNRGRRYQTALALAQDLERIRKMEPIRAKPPGPILRFQRWVQRRPAVAASIAGVVVALGLLGYGLGAAGKARTEASLKTLAIAERDRADAALARADDALAKLEQFRKDEAIRKSLTDLNTQFGTITFGGQYVMGQNGSIDVKPLCRKYLAAFEAYGLQLSRPGGSQSARALLETLEKRDPRLWGEIAQSFDDFLLALQMPHAIDGAADLATAQHETALAREVIKPDPFQREVNAALARWKADGDDDFARFLADADLKTRSAGDLALLGKALLQIPERKQAALDLVDRALDLEPDNYGLHAMRGGLALLYAQTDHAPGEFDRAFRHFSIATALRPRSGLAHCMLAVGLALQGQYERACAEMDKGTELEPDSAFLWMIAADFFNRGPDTSRTIRAARRAHELDPSLKRASALLLELGAPETR